MKLNPDCVRDVLLYVESNTDLKHFASISPSQMPDELSKYSADEVMYHIKQAELSALLDVPSWYLDGGCLIKYLLPEGHQFLANIREDNNWNKTKRYCQISRFKFIRRHKADSHRRDYCFDSGETELVITSITISSSASPFSFVGLEIL